MAWRGVAWRNTLASVSTTLAKIALCAHKNAWKRLGRHWHGMMQHQPSLSCTYMYYFVLFKLRNVTRRTPELSTGPNPSRVQSLTVAQQIVSGGPCWQLLSTRETSHMTSLDLLTMIYRHRRILYTRVGYICAIWGVASARRPGLEGLNRRMSDNREQGSLSP